MAIDSKNAPLVVGQKLTASILGKKFDVILRGWYIGQYIIADLPLVNNEPLRLVAGTGCDIGFIKEGEFFTFSGMVSHAFPMVPIMCVQLPKTMDTHNLRHDKRMKVSFPANFSYFLVDKTVIDPCMIRDLSLTGALITHKKILQKGSKIVLNIPFETGALNNQDAVIQNIRHNPKSENETYVSGVKFPSVNSENKEVLKRYVAAQQAAKRV